ncbi:MAG: hypothetical protein K1X57_03435 [Gemmataceae bacterium]|nr:hypothetical protein [Gemmataceae bacterium]
MLPRLVFLFALLATGCATADKLSPVPISLPEDAAATSYGDLHPKLRQLAWRATEGYYRDDWKELGETASSIEKAAKLLKSTKDVPARLVDLPGKCDALTSEATALKAAAAGPTPDAISARLQKIHNLIRELRPEN